MFVLFECLSLFLFFSLNGLVCFVVIVRLFVCLCCCLCLLGFFLGSGVLCFRDLCFGDTCNYQVKRGFPYMRGTC